MDGWMVLVMMMRMMDGDIMIHEIITSLFPTSSFPALLSLQCYAMTTVGCSRAGVDRSARTTHRIG